MAEQPERLVTQEPEPGTRHWRTWLETNFVFVCVYSPDGRLTAANPAALAAAGALPQEVVGRHFSNLKVLAHSPESTARLHQLFERARRGETFRADIDVRLEGGRLATVDSFVCPLRDADGRVVEIATAAVEIGVSQQVETTLSRLNRELRMLRRCTQALVRAEDEKALLDTVCQTIVESGEYLLAWVGFADNDPARTIRPVARAGRGQSYLDHVRISWGDTEFGRGPAGRAVRECAAQVCHDMQSDPTMGPWRDEATLHGYRSSIALPLVSVGAPLGVISIYCARPDAFDEPETMLLAELARDLAYGIAALRARAERSRAQGEAQRFRALLDQANDFIYVFDAHTGRIQDANDAVARRLGYSKRELLQMNVRDFSLTAAKTWPQLEQRVRSGEPLVLEGLHRAKDGTRIDVEISLKYVEQEDQHFVIAVTRDVTERKHQQERIARLARMLHMQASISEAVLRIRDPDELLREACRIASDVGGYDRAVFSRVQPDGRTARPQFRAGGSEDFPEPAVLEISDGTEPDTGLSGRALRTGEVTICSDLSHSEPPVTMRAELLALGYRSLVALPLLIGGRRLGVLTMTSKDASLVRDDELLLLQDITATLSAALRALEHAEAAQFLASFDPLTGLAQRALFSERLDHLLRADVDPQRGSSVAVFDIHHLSHINDTYGRRLGDLVLREVAERLKSRASGDDRIGYLGGGVFALVESGLGAGESAISEILENEIFSTPVVVDGRSLRLSYRSGIAHSPIDGSDASTLLERAEAAHKHAKEAGEPYLHYQLEMHSETAQRLNLEHRLRVALDERQFELYYQPQIAYANDRIESVEALLRWNDPERGLVSPGAFLPVLESSGLIVPVGEWALRQVIEDCERWTRLGLPPLRVAVNVSAIQLQRKSFVPTALEAARLIAACPGRGLDLEITESTVLRDLEGTSRKLRELRSAAIRIALDDFGTGYSALGLLPKLPVDIVKIDRSFVEGLPHDPSSKLLVESILRLVIGLRLVSVAEGIESPEQYEALRAMSCSLWQGYLHGPPVSREQLERRIATGQPDHPVLKHWPQC